MKSVICGDFLDAPSQENETGLGFFVRQLSVFKNSLFLVTVREARSWVHQLGYALKRAGYSLKTSNNILDIR